MAALTPYILGDKTQSLLDIIDFKLYFKVEIDDTDPLGFTSQRGPTEVEGDFSQLCVQHVETSNAPISLFKFVQCVNGDQPNIPAFDEICGEDLNLDIAAITECYSNSARSLLTDSALLSAEKHITWSPTIIVGDGEPCEWKRSCPQDIVLIKEQICAAYTGTLPPACS